MTRVTAELREAVFARDGKCVLYLLEPDHVCRDQWGQPHIASRTDLCTLEHVKSELRMGLRAPNDLAHLLTLCWAANLRPPTKEQRVMFREYLAEVNA